MRSRILLSTWPLGTLGQPQEDGNFTAQPAPGTPGRPRTGTVPGSWPLLRPSWPQEGPGTQAANQHKAPEGMPRPRPNESTNPPPSDSDRCKWCFHLAGAVSERILPRYGLIRWVLSRPRNDTQPRTSHADTFRERSVSQVNCMPAAEGAARAPKTNFNTFSMGAPSGRFLHAPGSQALS